jgi:hypothetical protein
VKAQSSAECGRRRNRTIAYPQRDTLFHFFTAPSPPGNMGKNSPWPLKSKKTLFADANFFLALFARLIYKNTCNYSA